MKKWTKKTKMTVVLGVLGIALITGGSAYAYTSSQAKQQLEAAQTEVTNQEAALKTLNKDLKGYFDQNSPSFLVENMDESQIKDLKKDVKNATTLKETTLKVDHSTFDKEVDAVTNTMTTLETTFNLQLATNKLFQSTAVNGSKVSKDLVISDDLNMDIVDNVKSMLGLTAGSTDKEKYTPFDNVIIDLVGKAESQLKQIDTATQAVKEVYTENKVVSTETKLYDTAKIEVDKIKNTKAKETLTDQLSKVKADIDKKTKEAEEKSKQDAATAATKDQQAAEAQQQVQKQSADDQGQAQSYEDNGSGSTTNTGGYTGGNGETGYTPPASGGNGSEQASAGGGGQTTTPAPPASNNTQQPTYPEYPTGEQSGTLPEGGTWTGSWSGVN